MKHINFFHKLFAYGLLSYVIMLILRITVIYWTFGPAIKSTNVVIQDSYPAWFAEITLFILGFVLTYVGSKYAFWIKVLKTIPRKKLNIVAVTIGILFGY